MASADPPVEDQPPPDLTHRMDVPNRVPLHLVEAGPADGPPVVLLHGFPEFWFGWRRQIRPLVDAGYRVLVPDQRGYNRSAKPRAIDAYTLDELSADVAGLIDALGPDAAVVGHDFGGTVAWWTALTYPERVRQLIVLNMADPVTMKRAYRTDPRQILKGWYAFLFQLPFLPEVALGAADGWLLSRAIRATSRGDAFSDAALERYRTAWTRPNALRSMLHWYRAIVRHPPARPADPRIEPPTMILWGVQDAFLRPKMATAALQHCIDGRLEYIEGTSHWIHHEAPETVRRHLLEALGHHS